MMTAAGRIPAPPHGEHRPPARVSGRRLTTGLVAAAVLAVALAVGSRAVVARLAPGWAGGDGLVVLQVAEGYLAVIVALTLAAGGPAGVRDRLALHGPTGRDIACGGLALVAAAAVCAVVYPVLGLLGDGVGATGIALVAAGSDLARLPGASGLVLALILVRVALLSGLAEELLFRGALYGWLRTYLTALPTIVITTLLFAAEHAYYPILLPVVVALGVATGWVRHHTGVTTVPVGMHVVADLGLLAAACALT